MKNNELNNVDNYNKELQHNESVYFLKYIGFIHELIEISIDNIYIQNIEYLKYVLIKAIKNTSYIYTFLLLYTRNLELSIYHTQKSILYYIEFIGQIGDDNHSFLKLNSKDATLFVFKKTIFDVNQDFRKEFKESNNSKEIFNKLDSYITIYNNLIINTISNIEPKDNNILNQLQYIIFTKLYKIVDSLIQLKRDNNYMSNLNNILEITNLFIKYFSKPYIKDDFLNLIDFIIRKINKKKIHLENIKKKFENDDTVDYMKNMSVCKSINYLIG